jgi:hypothetical protein
MAEIRQIFLSAFPTPIYADLLGGQKLDGCFFAGISFSSTL